MLFSRMALPELLLLLKRRTYILLQQSGLVKSITPTLRCSSRILSATAAFLRRLNHLQEKTPGLSFSRLPVVDLSDPALSSETP